MNTFEDKYLDLIQQTLYREIGEGTILNYRILVETESNTVVELRVRVSRSLQPTRISKKGFGEGAQPF